MWLPQPDGERGQAHQSHGQAKLPQIHLASPDFAGAQHTAHNQGTKAHRQREPIGPGCVVIQRCLVLRVAALFQILRSQHARDVP